MSKRDYSKAEKRSWLNGFKYGSAKKEKEIKEKYILTTNPIIEDMYKHEPFKYDSNSNISLKNQQGINDLLDDIMDVMKAQQISRINKSKK